AEVPGVRANCEGGEDIRVGKFASAHTSCRLTHARGPSIRDRRQRRRYLDQDCDQDCVGIGRFRKLSSLSRFSLSSREWPRLVFAAMAGAALALAFPKFNVAGLAWFAPGAIL